MWSKEEIASLARELRSQYGRSFNFVRGGPALLFRSGKTAIRLSRPADKTLDDLERERRLIDWLGRQGIPTIRPREEVRPIAGCPALVYNWIEDDGKELSWFEFGELVLRLHQLEAPEWLAPYQLPDPYKKRAADLLLAGVITEAEAQVILGIGDKALLLCHKEASQGSPAKEALLHGDLHSGNLISSGGLFLIDWEDAGRGPRAIDFSSILQRPRFFSLSADEYEAFGEGYGMSITSSPLAEGMISLRIANSITHLLLGNEPRVAEGRRRLADIMSEDWGDPDLAIHWRDA